MSRLRGVLQRGVLQRGVLQRGVLQRELLPRPWLTDAALVAALTALASASGIALVAPASPPGAFVPGPASIVLWAVAYTAPLLLRRRFPCTVLVVTAVHFLVYWPVGRTHEFTAWLVLGVAVFSAFAYGRLRRAAWCAGSALAVLTALVLVGGLVTGSAGLPTLVVFAVNNALPYALGGSLGS